MKITIEISDELFKELIGKKDKEESIKEENYKMEELIVSNYDEVERVLEQLRYILDTYGLVRVADLYDLLGIEAHYEDTKHGWFDLPCIPVKEVKDGYLIKMPKVTKID